MVTPAAGSSLKPGQLVFGVATKPACAAGGLADHAAIPEVGIVALLGGLAPVDAATIGIAGLTAYQSIVPYVKKGDHIFINGGSGGTGVFSIQIAKTVGCYVATACSSRNVVLCQSLGADEVVDYTNTNVVEALKKSAKPFDHVVDNVGADHGLYWRCHEYTKPGTQFVSVGATPSFGELGFRIKALSQPGFLGGRKRKMVGVFAQPRVEELRKIAAWMQQGKVKAVIDERFAVDQSPDAFRRLKTGISRGKIVVDMVSGEPRNNA